MKQANCLEDLRLKKMKMKKRNGQKPPGSFEIAITHVRAVCRKRRKWITKYQKTSVNSCLLLGPNTPKQTYSSVISLKSILLFRLVRMWCLSCVRTAEPVITRKIFFSIRILCLFIKKECSSVYTIIYGFHYFIIITCVFMCSIRRIWI